MIPVALILGGAWCVHEDVKALQELVGGPWPGPVIAVNDIGEVYQGRIHHWATCHPLNLTAHTRRRIENGLPGPWETWCPAHVRHARFCDHQIEGSCDGASGLFAVRDFAWKHLGLRSVLCGMPMTPEPHFAESRVHPTGEAWKHHGRHWEPWVDDAGALRGYCRSVSGEYETEDGTIVGTKHLLGEATREWVFEGPGVEVTTHDSLPERRLSP